MIVADDPNDPIQCIRREIKILKQLREIGRRDKIIDSIYNDLENEEKENVMRKSDITNIKRLTDDNKFKEDNFTEYDFKEDNFVMFDSLYKLINNLVYRVNQYSNIIEIYKKNINKSPSTEPVLDHYGLDENNLFIQIDNVYNNHRTIFDAINNLKNIQFKYFYFKRTYKNIYAMCKEYKIEFNFEYCKDWETSITPLITFKNPSSQLSLIHKKTKIEIIFPVYNDEFIEFVNLHSAINDKYVSDWKNTNADIIKANYKKYCTEFLEDMNKFDYNKYVQEQTALIEKSTNKTGFSEIADTTDRTFKIFTKKINTIKNLTDRMKIIVSDTDDIFEKLESFSTSITLFKEQITTLQIGLDLLRHNRFQDYSTE